MADLPVPAPSPALPAFEAHPLSDTALAYARQALPPGHAPRLCEPPNAPERPGAGLRACRPPRRPARPGAAHEEADGHRAERQDFG